MQSKPSQYRHQNHDIQKKSLPGGGNAKEKTMQRCLHFFASKQDLCNIFKAVEQEFSIKYCADLYRERTVRRQGEPRLLRRTLWRFYGD